MRVKIVGAGSIGNHLAHASRSLGWDVTVSDLDPKALRRMREDIYPSRYGEWDDAIRLTTPDRVPRGSFDAIFIGTPPESHLSLALAALEEGPRALLIEKPACPPDLEGAVLLAERAAAGGVHVIVGYNHVVAPATHAAEELVRSGAIGDVVTIDVDWREHWRGIFAAHPWLSGPADSYLGFWRRGGGAAGEHSHGVNLWQHFAHVAGGGRVTEVTGAARYVSDGVTDYDEAIALALRTEHGLFGTVVQDVVGVPPRKIVHLQGTTGSATWIANHDAGGDAVVLQRPGHQDETTRFEKTRPDDFIRELEHLAEHLESGTASPTSLDRGLDTALVIAAGHESAHSGRRIGIAYEHGYTRRALG